MASDYAAPTIEAQKGEVYRIRYSVYCEEFNYEQAKDRQAHV
jgi:hypothetical protein